MTVLFRARLLLKFKKIRGVAIPVSSRADVNLETNARPEVLVHQTGRHPRLLAIMRLRKWTPAFSATKNRPSRRERELGRAGFPL